MLGLVQRFSRPTHFTDLLMYFIETFRGGLMRFSAVEAVDRCEKPNGFLY